MLFLIYPIDPTIKRLKNWSSMLKKILFFQNRC